AANRPHVREPLPLDKRRKLAIGTVHRDDVPRPWRTDEHIAADESGRPCDDDFHRLASPFASTSRRGWTRYAAMRSLPSAQNGNASVWGRPYLNAVLPPSTTTLTSFSCFRPRTGPRYPQTLTPPAASIR